MFPLGLVNSRLQRSKNIDPIFVLKTDLVIGLFRLREIMDQLDSGKSLSVTDVKQELGIAVAMLDKATAAAPLRDYRYVIVIVRYGRDQ